MIYKNGADITEEIFSAVKDLRARRPLQAVSAIEHLALAREELRRQPTPWLFDCIYASIKKIDDIIEELRNPEELRD